MKVPAGNDKFLLMFVPEQIDPVRVIGMFEPIGVSDLKKFRKGLKTVDSHMDKFRTFVGLANKLIPGFDIDRKQLDEMGHTPAVHSKEFAAIIESCVCELYSSIDGVRYVLHSLYRKVAGIPEKSNEKLFKKAHMGELGESFPERLNALLSDAYLDWFKELREFRTDMVHGSLGSCSMDPETKIIRYFHASNRKHGMDDFVDYIGCMYRKVSEFLNLVFDYLYMSLTFKNSSSMCGIYKGRCYERLISAEYPLRNSSGYCVSRQWFEAEKEFYCPLANNCLAYANAVSEL